MFNWKIILSSGKKNKKTKGDMSLHDTIGTDGDGNEITLIDVLSSDEDSVIDIVELKMQLKEIYNKINIGLNEREKAVIQMCYGLLDGNP